MTSSKEEINPFDHLAPKETSSMLSRSERLVLVVLAALTIGVSAFMAAPASAAPQPWWQVLTGSRPTNMWEPTDNIQEIQTQAGPFGAAIEVKVDGETIACLGSGLAGPFFCPPGFPPIETAPQLEATLETVFDTSAVEVTGGPLGSEPFTITTTGRSEPTIEVNAVNSFSGSASSKVVSIGGSGTLVIIATNLGDAPVDATSTPVRIVDELPEGVRADGAIAFAGPNGVNGSVECTIEASDKVSCGFEGTLPPYEAIEIEISAALTGAPPVAGAPGKVTVSGGNAAPASDVQKVRMSPEPTPFGIERFSAVSEEEGGTVARQAGSHPFQFTTTVQFNSGPNRPPSGREEGVEQPAIARNLRTMLPAGLIGNATVMPTCDMQTFLTTVEAINECPDSTAVGAASVTFFEPNNLGLVRLAVPVFNLPPANGEPARFGFMVAGSPVLIDTSVDPDDRYRITAAIRNLTQVVDSLSGTVSFWGTPGDPRHDSVRGWGCLYYTHPGPCNRPPNLSENAFFRQPVSCDAPLDFGVQAEPWNVSLGSVVEEAQSTQPGMVGCNKVPFDPAIKASPTSKLAENPSGFNFRLDMPNAGLLNREANAEGQAKKVEVTLPKGMTVNPSEGEGLVGCSLEAYERESAASLPGEGCPEASKIGTVQVTTPLLKEEARGTLYVASPYDNPFDSLLGLYMVARIPERGIVIKQAGKVDADPVTGQLTTTFDDLPQLPFSSFKLEFRPGARAPLVTPPACGDYELVARFTPWSSVDPDNPTPAEVVTRETSFEIERGVDGGACPAGGVPPFRPGLNAGTINNAAGHFSPFNLRLTRNDGEQEFTNFSIKLPPGLVGKLAGIPLCSDAAIAAAKARTGAVGGQEELDTPSCPAGSGVGRTLVGAGVGASLVYVPGKVYLAGPYNGSPLSVVAITAAKVGPFDLGTVVVREALRVNPDTAEVFIDATGSDPIPHIIQGIPVHARDIRVYVDRPEFTLNPTSCEPSSVASTVLGSGLDFGSAADDNPVTVTTRFQAADCAALRFKPKLKLRLIGPTHRGANPKLRATLNMRGFGESAIARASVTLPHSEFLDQSHIRTVCTRVQFNAGAGNGAECPQRAIYGYARAWTPILDEPVKGPVFLRSSSHPLPDLVAALHGQEININLVGRIDSIGNGRIRNTFEAVPDAPVSKFVLEMQGGKKGLLDNSTELCRGRHRALAVFDGHNGKQRTSQVPLKADCGGRKKQRGRS